MPKIKTNNVETYYEIHGEGTPLVLIPGMGMCHKLWMAQIEPFSQRFKVITYDVRGHGESGSSNEKYSIKLFAGDLQALLAELHVTKAHVCGLSMGGLIAQQFAIDYPDMVDKLIIVGSFSHLGLKEKILAAYLKAVHRVLFMFMSMEQYAKLHAKGLFSKEEQQELRVFFVKENIDNISKKEFLKAMAATSYFNCLDHLKEIKSPTLILTAERGKTERRQSEAIHRGIKNSRQELILDTFHASNLEKPEEFNKLVLDFLLKG
jgi:pimeloyl-ACP methyl ester carboxylesterase